jgi:hypothetical protein
VLRHVHLHPDEVGISIDSLHLKMSGSDFLGNLSLFNLLLIDFVHFKHRFEGPFSLLCQQTQTKVAFYNEVGYLILEGKARTETGREGFDKRVW